MILSLSDPGSKKGGDKKSCHVRIESMLGSGGGGRRTGKSGWGLEGAIIVIYIHTHTHNGWLMGKQAGQGGGRKEDGWALLLNTEQRIRDDTASLSGPKNTTVYYRWHQDAKSQKGNVIRPSPFLFHSLTPPPFIGTDI